LNISNIKNSYEWAVIGAGPAGMASVGKLIDLGVNPKNIAWIDPEFKVGDLGAKWRNVSSNTRVDLFVKFLEGIKAFNYKNCPKRFELHDLKPDQTCLLKYAADPLAWVSQELEKQVNPIRSKVLKLKMQDRHWQMTLDQNHSSHAPEIPGNIQARNIILAVGSEPKTMPSPIPLIPMEDALDKEKLAKWVDHQDVVGVFGASHSAIIVIRLLLELGVKEVINFYRAPLRYAVYMDNWILFDNTGLKGETGKWARENIDGKMPENLTRVFSSEENNKAYLPRCTQAVQAIGFNRRNIVIEGMPVIEYNDKSGIIAPGLFGFGIAFPETTVDTFGNIESSVGLFKFLNYLNRVAPVWQKYVN